MSGLARPMRRRPRAWSLALAVLGMWALAVLPLLAAQHRANHRHVTCEHGEQIEVEAARHLASAPPADHSVEQRSDGGTGTEVAHHHCTLSCAVTTAVAERPILTVASLARSVAIAAAPRQTPPALDVLVDAPKTSPPVAG